MTRRDPDVSALTNLDALILAQAVYELGGDSWSDVAKLLSKHPLLSHPKSFFTPQSCQAFYTHLRREASLEITEEDVAVRAPLNLKLAKVRYQARYIQLRELIGEEEEKFKRIWSEIETIRNGQNSAVIQLESKERTDEATQLHMEDAAKPSSSTPGVTFTSTTEIEPSREAHSRDPEEPPSGAVSGPEPTEGARELGLSDTEIIHAQTKDRETKDEQEATQKADDDTSSLSNAPSPQPIQIDDLFEPETEENEDIPREPEQQKPGQVHSFGLELSDSVPEAQDSMVVDEATSHLPSGAEQIRTEEPVDVSSPDVQPQREISTPMEVEGQPSGSSGPSEPPIETLKRTSPHIGDHNNDRPVVERTSEPVSAEDGGESSDDEPLNIHKNRKASRRGKSSAAAARAAKARRRRKSSAAVEILPTDQDQDGKPEDIGSPDPEAISTKQQGKRRASVLEDHDTRDKKRARDGSEPAEEEDSGKCLLQVAQ
ncbi:hypothetical protein E1B28_004331 [Marasmius oreades]|uniref:Uncharacterized protein n=1 Tax=Marasmius oreades TaxID=181124 RepID=A0A9P7UYH1_9AGAR|nr:uncharacterized protein E1B28_004331 [Marasmius oreades]KAG7096931.1 hypothetical protein E1B28_004331 [Marasmius oreades]